VTGFLIRLLLSGLFFILVFYSIGSGYIRLYLPLFKNEIEFLHPEYEVIQSTITNESAIKYFEFIIKVNKPLAMDQNAEQKSGNIFRLKGQASSLCIAPVIIFSLILSWPALSVRQRLKALLISLPLIVIIECLDYPAIFIGNIESVHSVNILSNTLRKIWSHILNNGGRQFLALIVFLIVISPFILKSKKPGGEVEENRPLTVGRNAPCPCGSGKKYKNCCLSNN